MKGKFHNNNESNNKNISSSVNIKFNFKKFRSKLGKKHSETMNILKRYYQTSKSEIDYYYRFSSRLRRRNSIEGSTPKTPRKNKKMNRTNTLIDQKKALKLINLEDLDKESIITAEKMHQNLMENPTYNNVEQRIKFLTNLNPFYDDFSRFERHSEAIISTIAPDYKGKIIQENKIIFRYGDELNEFYLIHKGKVNIYCPFTQSIYMNIDEYYIYLLRLRRYGEIEMLNNVLLMNNLAFMRNVEDQFSFDRYILKLYNTFIKIKFAPVYLNQKENNKYSNNYSKSKEKIFMNQNEYNDVLYKSFNDNDMKNLALRIQDELTETMMYIYPEEMKQIIKEVNDDGIMVKKIKKLPDYIINQYKNMNQDEINGDIIDDYIKRISPIKILDTNLQRQKVTIMKYVFIKTLSKGNYLGENILDSNEYFSPKLLRNMKRSKLNLNIHQHEHFYNITAISVKDTNTDNNSGYLYLGYLRREYYNQYFKKFVEKIEYPKKRFILNNRLFKNNNNENFIKTYAKCFRKRILKENECLINEKDVLSEGNTYIYFIVKGEFQSLCNQTVQSIDEILKALNCEEKIKETIPIKLKEIKDTFFFEEICKKELKIKMSYLTENDIIGLSENIFKDRYFNSVYCLSKEGVVYYVDIRIINLFVEGNKIIHDNKNFLLYEKYKVLSDLLLKQRKSYLDSYSSFQIDSVKERENTFNINTLKKDNILKSKSSFKKTIANASQNSKNSLLKIRNKVLNEPKEKKYTSLSSVCDVLTKIYSGVSFEVQRKERSLLFRKNYYLKNKKQKKNKSQNNKELDMTIDIMQEIENQKSSFVCFKNSGKTSIKSLKSQRSNPNLRIKYSSNNYIKNQKYNNLILLKNFFINEKENDKDNKEKENITIKSQMADLKPLSYETLWINKNNDKRNISNNILKANDFFKNMQNNFVRINNIRLNKLRKIQLNRKEMINQKLRNIYYSDLDKILLSEHFNKYLY